MHLQKMGFEDLDRHLLVRILSYLDPSPDLFNATLCCKVPTSPLSSLYSCVSGVNPSNPLNCAVCTIEDGTIYDCVEHLSAQASR